MHKIHLVKGGAGFGTKFACGGSILSRPLGTTWNEFKNINPKQQCEKCAASKQAALNARMDAKKLTKA
jgi:hypothetical protein